MKCTQCDHVAKNEVGLKIHMHWKHKLPPAQRVKPRVKTTETLPAKKPAAKASVARTDLTFDDAVRVLRVKRDQLTETINMLVALQGAK